MSKLSGMLRAMDAYERRNAPEPDEYGYWTRQADGGLHYHAYDPATEDDEDEPQTPQDSAVCALADCDEPAAVTCVCCGRQVCWHDISGAVLDIEPGPCCDCLAESA
jgi:hypothetical protein